MGGPDGGQHHGGVGSADQEINGAVVDDLHYLFAHAGLQTVVDAGNGEHGDEGGAVDGAADDAVVVLIQGGPHHAGQQHNDAQRPADNVGNHVHQLFAPGIVRQLPVRQFCSFHSNTSRNDAITIPQTGQKATYRCYSTLYARERRRFYPR